MKVLICKCTCQKSTTFWEAMKGTRFLWVCAHWVVKKSWYKSMFDIQVVSVVIVWSPNTSRHRTAMFCLTLGSICKFKKSANGVWSALTICCTSLNQNLKRVNVNLVFKNNFFLSGKVVRHSEFKCSININISKFWLWWSFCIVDNLRTPQP